MVKRIFGIPVKSDVRRKGVGTFFNEGSVDYLGTDGKMYRKNTKGVNMTPDEVADAVVNMYTDQEIDLKDPNTQELFSKQTPHPDIPATSYRRRGRRRTS